tara:strand:- start:119089 stop:119607 length:519 start_codon:yes stop_codon:yes gene_type:complete
MHKNNPLLIGTVSKLHGYKGKIKIFILEKINFDFNITSYLLIKNNNDLVPYIIEYAKVIKENIMLVKFDDVNNEEEAKKILKKDVYISAEFVEEKQFIQKNKLIGYNVVDKNLGKLGVVSYINNQTSQKLIFIKNKLNKEFCIPMHENFIKKIHHKEKTLDVIIPEELINLN